MSAMQSRDEIFATIKSVMIELFEIEPERIKPESNLFTELDIDSIDAVDLVVRLRDITGKKVKPEDFKEVVTINDVIDAVEKMLAT
jgi:acyl carrier protein